MDFSIILLSNGIHKKTLHTSKKRKTAFINFNRLVENNKVLFPKRYLNSVVIKKVKYEICLTKKTEPDDVNRLLRDDYGKLYVEKNIGDLTVITSSKYEVEETFYIYGFVGDSRPTITEVIKRLMVNVYAKNSVKQIIVVNNKLIIYTESQFDMVICKNKNEAQRLHHTLAKIANKQKIKNLLFMGTAGPATTTLLYNMIADKTGWGNLKIRRTSTRP